MQNWPSKPVRRRSVDRGGGRVGCGREDATDLLDLLTLSTIERFTYRASCIDLALLTTGSWPQTPENLHPLGLLPPTADRLRQ